MAFIQAILTDPQTTIEETTEDILAASRETGGILVCKGEKIIVRISLSRTEAGNVAAKLAPHIP